VPVSLTIFFVKLSENYSKTTSGVLLNYMSDHFPYFIFLDYLYYQTKNDDLIKIRSNTLDSYKKFQEKLKTEAIKENFQNVIGNDPNESYERFNAIISPLIKECFPIKYVKFDKHKHKKSDWMTNGILKSIIFRDKLYRKLKKIPKHKEKYTKHKEKLQSYNKILRQIIKKNKRKIL
jgi:vacuolar-type H+-ATPase catalytic subunit A/Vma1